MDEAFSALDPLIRMDMQSVLLDLQKEIRKTVVFITHDLDEALRLGDRIAILRDGEVVQQGTKQEIVLRPADEYISSFVREVNRGRVISVDMVMTPLSGEPQGMPVKLGTVLEVAAKKMTDSSLSIAHVTDADGKPVGELDIQQVISAMVTPVDHENAA
jgi:glycine betaine/proline transport system ATP-binding protein